MCIWEIVNYTWEEACDLAWANSIEKYKGRRDKKYRHKDQNLSANDPK